MIFQWQHLNTQKHEVFQFIRIKQAPGTFLVINNYTYYTAHIYIYFNVGISEFINILYE